MSDKYTVVVGLCEGRHEMPVDKYIFKSVLDVHDYEAINKTVMDFLVNEVGISLRNTCGINQSYGCDEPCFTGDKDLVVYVTGLTALTVAIVRACALNGVSLTLMHYDCISKEYVPQDVF